LEVFVPEKTVVGTLPEGGCGWRCLGSLRGISVERVGEVVSIGKVERAGIKVFGDQVYESHFIGILDIRNIFHKEVGLEWLLLFLIVGG
jgi:hypothetical protein